LHSAVLAETAGDLSNLTSLAILAGTRCYKQGARNPTTVSSKLTNSFSWGYLCQSFPSLVTALKYEVISIERDVTSTIISNKFHHLSCQVFCVSDVLWKWVWEIL